MKLTTVFCLIVPLLVNAGSDPECPPNQWVEGGCEANPHLCRIECPVDPCTPSEGNPGPCSTGEDIALGDMDAAKCKELCEASRDGGSAVNPDICRFWRFETVPTGDAKTVRVKTCTLIRSSECTAHEECLADCECGDVGCPGDKTGTTLSPEISCKGGIEYHPEADWIHWVCMNDEVPDLNSPYHPGDDSVLPPNTNCFTTHPCDDWNSEVDMRLSVRCDGLTGKWVKATTGDDPTGHYVGDKGVLGPASGTGSQPAPLQEHQCIANSETEPLVVNIANMGEGAQLSCETPATVNGDPPTATYSIKAPNSCVLLCDFHPVLVIKGRLNEEGVFKFYDTNTGDEINDSNKDGKIRCWPEH